jgi:HEAT repeat protein
MSDILGEIRRLLSGGDRRSIAKSNRVRLLIEQNPSLVADLAALTADDDWLVTQRALDLLEKLAHDHPEWIAPHKKIFVGPLAESDKWEIRLQIVRALPLFRWSPAQARRVEEILLENVACPQTFVRAWALDGLATLAEQRAALLPIVRRHLREFEASPSKALQARAKHIRARLGGPSVSRPSTRSPDRPTRHAARETTSRPTRRQ